MIYSHPCGQCDQDITAQTSTVDPAEFTPDDFAAIMHAQSEHLAGHPDSLRTQGGPDPRPKRDWVGCRCRGTCRCRR